MSEPAEVVDAPRASTTDVPALLFVDPAETDPTYRFCIWAAPGQGKSCAAASAPAPILVVSADRPSAYRFARKLHGHTTQTLREVRYQGPDTLELVYRYLRENTDVKTVVIDPISHVYDGLTDVAPTVVMKGRKAPDYQWVNKKVLGFVKSLRAFDVNVVLVAHEKLNDGDSGDGKLYPALGGPSLINKLLAEMDVVAHVERIPKPTDDDEKAAVWVGQIQPRDNLVTKDSTDALGDRRIADLSRWVEVANEALAPDTSDLPWGEQDDPENRDPDDVAEGAGKADVPVDTSDFQPRPSTGEPVPFDKAASNAIDAADFGGSG